MLAKVKAAVVSLDAIPITVEVDVAAVGLPSLQKSACHEWSNCAGALVGCLKDAKPETKTLVSRSTLIIYPLVHRFAVRTWPSALFTSLFENEFMFEITLILFKRNLLRFGCAEAIEKPFKYDWHKEIVKFRLTPFGMQVLNKAIFENHLE